jgi:hypothetical protein
MGAVWPLFEVTVGELPQLQWTVRGDELLCCCGYCIKNRRIIMQMRMTAG